MMHVHVYALCLTRRPYRRVDYWTPLLINKPLVNWRLSSLQRPESCSGDCSYADFRDCFRSLAFFLQKESESSRHKGRHLRRTNLTKLVLIKLSHNDCNQKFAGAIVSMGPVGVSVRIQKQDVCSGYILA